MYVSNLEMAIPNFGMYVSNFETEKISLEKNFFLVAKKHFIVFVLEKNCSDCRKSVTFANANGKESVHSHNRSRRSRMFLCY
jgi:hypothetical protein